MVEQLSLLNEITVATFRENGEFGYVFKTNLPNYLSQHERRNYLDELLEDRFPNSSLIFISLDMQTLGYPYMKKPNKK